MTSRDRFRTEGTTTLDDTNHLLYDLERKLSLTSNTSSQQTHTSSVVHSSHLLGLGRQNIQSQVLNQIMNDEELNNQDDKHQRIHNSIFNPDEIFQERQNNKYMTSKFAKNYNDDNLTKNHKLNRKNSLNISKSRLERNSCTSEDIQNNKPLPPAPQQQQENNEYDINKSISGIHEVEDPSMFESEEDLLANHLQMPQEVEHNNNSNNNNQEEPRYGIFYGGDDYEDSDSGDESDSEGDIPLSPPRSPPRDLDPDKLYGLYDFSGPDPSHCTLLVDEPVYLINDEDNYWWLIRKLTKLERLKRMRLNGQEFQIDIESDEEDGKIGFVPAECLETHGERLARLNCFKNEELEKKSPTPSSLQESTDSFKNQRQTATTKKSVTFENLGDIIDDYSDEEIKSDHENIRQNLDLYNNLEPPTHLQEIKEPEVLSDVYPAETPLIISKNNNNNKDSSNKTATPTFQMSNTFDAVFVQPKQRSSGLFDDASIGSYSPDTPVKAKSPLRVEVQDDDSDEMGRNNSLSSMSSLRRSVILDRLTQMTSDIQEQLQLDGYNEDEDEDEEEQEEDAGEVEEELDEDKHKEDDETEKESTDVEQGSSRDSDHEVHGFSFEESSEQFTSDDDYDDDDDDNVEHHSPSNDGNVESQDYDYQNDDHTPQLIDQHDYSKHQQQTPTNFHSISSAISPKLQRLLSTTLSSVQHRTPPPVSQLTSPNFHRSPPPQSHQQYAVSPLNYNRLPRSTTSIDDETSSTEENNDDNITPLTSMNSLTPIEERRKLKPVHEMFMPILGKFDELAEKLAELDDIL